MTSRKCVDGVGIDVDDIEMGGNDVVEEMIGGRGRGYP
jgi:hypothetical protein